MARKSKFTEEQIAYAPKRAAAGVPVAEVCRKCGVSEQTYHVWRKKYGGLAPSKLARLRVLETENKKRKALVADLSVDEQRRYFARRHAGVHEVLPGPP